MVSPRIYKTLPEDERRLWHSHVYEVKSGMLILPTPAVTPTAVWEAAETAEMEDVVGIYGKTYHFWQVDRGDKVPMGTPELMMSFTKEEQVGKEAREMWADRDKRFGVDTETKKEKRSHIKEPQIHEGMLEQGSDVEGANRLVDADSTWNPVHTG